MPRVHLTRARLAAVAAFMLASVAFQSARAQDAGVDADDQAEEARAELAAPLIIPPRFVPPPGPAPDAGVHEPPAAPPLAPSPADVEAQRRVIEGLIETGIRATTDALVEGVKRAPPSGRWLGALGVATGAAAATGGLILGDELGLDARGMAGLSTGLTALGIALFVALADDPPADGEVADGQH